MTTRSSLVASIMGTVPNHNLYLALFLKWAFKEGQEKEHSYLVRIGNEMVKHAGKLMNVLEVYKR